MTTLFPRNYDANEYKILQKELMNLPEEVRFQEINTILNQNFRIGLKLANAVLKDKKYFNILFEQGLEKANASDIEIWLKYLVPRLGIRRIIAVLSEKLNSEKPLNVAKASYWLPKFVPKDNQQANILLQKFSLQEKQILGGNYKAVNSSGQSYKLILRIKNTGEYAIFGGYQLGNNGSGIIVEILNPQDLYPTGGVKLVSPGDIEIVDPQPYND